ncbi:hypothetical protein HYU07_06100 [Candidatus Woesearchaeota archaeon]|nr:hypothetical protein [Candidatus Woesearchaeota archaeon]
MRSINKEADYVPVFGDQGKEAITSLRQTAGCFKVYEVNPAIGCDFGCTYCSMYGQESELRHMPVKVFMDYPKYLEQFIAENRNTNGLIFNFTPKSDAFCNALIDSGVTQRMFDVFIKARTEFYILTKSGIPRKDVQEKLIQAKDLVQIIISAGLPNEEYRAILEPNTPPIEERMAFGKFCAENGIQTAGIAAPFLPFSIEGYTQSVIDRYADIEVDHISVHLLKLSEMCLERLCKQLRGYGNILKKIYGNETSESIEWTLPGGKKVKRYYADKEIIKEELKKFKKAAKTKNITLSTCVEVEKLIEDLHFNDDARKKGITCVGFKNKR